MRAHDDLIQATTLITVECEEKEEMKRKKEEELKLANFRRDFEIFPF